VSWHWSATVGFALASCGGAGRAVPTEVEIQWPDAGAAPESATTALGDTDAGPAPADVEDSGPVVEPAAP
jgi:hypothetical protein